MVKVKISFLIIIFSVFSFAQNVNKIITDEYSEEPMLIGNCTREAFNDTSFSWWWNSEYDMYKVDSSQITKLEDLKNYNVEIIMGTWCSDSRQEVPRFIKILDDIKYPSDKIKIICVDRDRHSGNGEVKDLNIELVPTFIFYKNGKERGRIVEAPKETLEKDIINILNE